MPAQNTDPQTSPNIDFTNPYTPRRPAPIVSISVNHPIATAIRKIKNFLIHKQTLFSTTFNIKVTPIVALVSLFGIAALFGGGITTAFNYGKTIEQRLLAIAPTPTPQIIVKPPALIAISRSGTIKATYQNPPVISAAPEPAPIGTVSATITPIQTPQPVPTILHYILVSRGGSINFLNAAPGIGLHNYLNLRVLITGNFDSAKNILYIARQADIEVLLL